jgi:undecaprenyl-diphosphatase
MRGGLPIAVRRRLDPAERYGLRVTLFAIAVVLVAVPFSYLLIEVLRDGPFTAFDRDTATKLHDQVRGREGLIAFLKVVSFLGKPLLLGVAVAAGSVFVVSRGRKRLALYLVVTAIGGGLVDSAVKVLVNRSRPEIDDPFIHAFGKSFPSGHAMSSVVTYGALLLVLLPALRRRGRVLAYVTTLVLIIAIGLSRLMLGVHYVSDVLGGWALGLAWLVASTAAFSIWRQEQGKPPVDPAQGVEPEAGAALKGDTDTPGESGGDGVEHLAEGGQLVRAGTGGAGLQAGQGHWRLTTQRDRSPGVVENSVEG